MKNGILTLVLYLLTGTANVITLAHGAPYMKSSSERSLYNSKDTIPPQIQDSTKKEVQNYHWIHHQFNSTKYTPRIIKGGNQIFYNRNSIFFNDGHRTVVGTLYVTLLSSPIITKRMDYQYKFDGWHRGSHFIFDIYKGQFVYHYFNNLTYQKQVNHRTPFGPIKSIDIILTASIDSLYNKESNQNKPSKHKYRNGYLTKAFQNRQNGDSIDDAVTITNDSINANVMLHQSWYDFHIDKKGRTHAFVYMRGELIYLQQKKPSQNGENNTWIEIFSVPATDNIGPFTSVTVKGKQYLFTQDGTILKNTGKSMKQVDKLPADLRNCSVVWDKEKDKMWYITKEEFDAYKAGDTEVIQKMQTINISK